MASVGRMVKESMVEELSTELSKYPDFFVTTVNRLPASEADLFRRKLSVSQARLVVIKRRLGRRAIESLKLSGLAELLEGSVGLVLPGEDVLPIAKLIVEFIRTHEEQVAVRGAVIDGQVLDKSRVEQLANLPPKPVLLAQVVVTIESPLADVIFTLERLIGDVAWLAEQVAAKKPATEAGTPAAASLGEAKQAGVAEESPARPGEHEERAGDAKGGGTAQPEQPTEPTDQQTPKQEGTS